MYSHYCRCMGVKNIIPQTSCECIFFIHCPHTRNFTQCPHSLNFAHCPHSLNFPHCSHFWNFAHCPYSCNSSHCPHSCNFSHCPHRCNYSHCPHSCNSAHCPHSYNPKPKKCKCPFMFNTEKYTLTHILTVPSNILILHTLPILYCICKFAVFCTYTGYID